MGDLIHEFENLIDAWREYLRYCFYSKQLRKLRRIMFRRVITILFFILIGIISILWSIKAFVYGQEELTVGPVIYAPILSRFFSLTFGSSLIAMFIHFARKKFQQFKRLFDFLTASLGLVLVSPLMLIIAILIKFDSPGPVFFCQERLGKNGKIFKMWKFRTMRYNAEMGTGPVWAAEADPRITHLGNFLRKSHLDEIPQLINVFKGEMSLIGPRPERLEFTEMINGHIRNFNQRLKVRPGITGLAQVRYRYGASIKDAARKLKYDLLYIKRMCWMLDLRIMFWTVGRVLSGEGAR
jgi:exopolysaccharide biosynthesis polyprenyl glycosylphosphotransferase